MSDLFVAKCGSGAPIVVLHGGLGLDHTYLRPGLDGLGEGLELVYLDHRGNGRSAVPARWGEVTLATLADDVEAVRVALGYERWVVLGHSFGAAVALEYALRHPPRTASLIVVAGAAAFDHVEAIVAGAKARGPAHAVERYLGALEAPPASDAAFAEAWREVLPLYFHRWDERYLVAFERTRYSAAAYVRAAELLAGFDVRPQLGQIRAPTLVVSGEDDFVMPPAAAGGPLAEAVPGARHAVLERSGHFPFLEATDTFVREVRQFAEATATRPMQ